MIKAPQGNANRKFAPQENIAAGTYPARLVQIIDFGLQPQKPYQGKEKAPAHEIGFTYELVDEFMKDEDGNEIEDKPRWVSENFALRPLVADKAKSTQRYFAFDPDNVYDGDFSQLIAKPINVTIVNNKVGEKVYDNVGTVGPMRPRDAEKCPELKNPPKVFSLEEPDVAVFNSFPKWAQDKIKSNLNFNGSKLQKLLGNEPVEAKKEEAAPWKEEEEAEGNNNNNPY